MVDGGVLDDEDVLAALVDDAVAGGGRGAKALVHALSVLLPDHVRGGLRLGDFDGQLHAGALLHLQVLQLAEKLHGLSWNDDEFVLLLWFCVLRG